MWICGRREKKRRLMGRLGCRPMGHDTGRRTWQTDTRSLWRSLESITPCTVPLYHRHQASRSEREDRDGRWKATVRVICPPAGCCCRCRWTSVDGQGERREGELPPHFVPLSISCPAYPSSKGNSPSHKQRRVEYLPTCCMQLAYRRAENAL